MLGSAGDDGRVRGDKAKSVGAIQAGISSHVCGDKIFMFLTGSHDIWNCVCGDKSSVLKEILGHVLC